MNHTRKLQVFASIIGVLGIIMALLLAGCGQSGGGGGAAKAVAFEVTGQVGKEMQWSADEMQGMDTIEVEYTGKSGETETYTGVPVNDLLDKAEPKADASTVVFVGDDGYTAEAPLSEVRDCGDCIVGFMDEGGFRMVLPGFSGKVQVKGVVEAQVQ
jgi:hypothetical protein